ncbi:MAG: hypothetical protein H8D72_02090, partial [Planctomycetes bacterium]|nr:hypothetical protein [Planctomycetota bacterium]
MSPTLKSLGKELFVPVCLLVGVAAGAVLLGRATDRSAEQFFTRGLKQVGEVAAARLEDYIRLQERTINYAAEQILPSELELDLEGAPRVNISVGDFQRIGGSIAEWLPGFQAVNWVGLDGVIELVSPNDRNQDALGKNLLEHPDETVRKAFATAVASTDPGTAYVRYTPLIELYQGGPGFAVYRAVFDG